MTCSAITGVPVSIVNCIHFSLGPLRYQSTVTILPPGDGHDRPLLHSSHPAQGHPERLWSTPNGLRTAHQ